MGVVKGTISIKDNATAVLKSIKKEQSAFRKDVETTKKSLIGAWDKKYTAKIDATAAAKKMRQLKSAMQPLRDKVVAVVAIKDLATAKVKTVLNKTKALGKISVSPVVKIKDKVSSGISAVKGKLKSLTKALAIPITISATVAAGAAASLTSAVKGGMQLEEQQVSMKHFIGATNKGMSEDEISKVAAEFTNLLRNNANATPFETGEVMAAGSRAIAIAGGNTTQAMALVKLSEDMAAASGGTKNISDAIEALADAKLGETERLKEFGFKVSAEEFKSKGFGGVSSDLQDFYGGAAEKLASTGAGLLSTIKGKLKSNFADFGLKVVDKLKPTFESVIGLIDKASPMMEAFGTKIADKIGRGIEFAAGAVPKLSSAFETVKPVIGQAAAIIQGLINGISIAVTTLAPVFNTIFGAIGEKVGSVISFISERMGFVQEVIGVAAPIISDILTTAWGVISPVMDIAVGAFKLLFSVVQKVFPGVQKIITSVWDVIKPLVEGIGNVVGKISDGWNGLVDKFTGKEVGTNAKGTSNWRGGLTWVGEKGPELINLPHGSQVMPNKESTAYSKSQRNTGNLEVPAAAKSPQTGGIVSQIKRSISVTVAKLADTIVVREDADIDKIGAAVADKIVKVVLNMS